jgi:hypothetical protein
MQHKKRTMGKSQIVLDLPRLVDLQSTGTLGQEGFLVECSRNQ